MTRADLTGIGKNSSREHAKGQSFHSRGSSCIATSAGSLFITSPLPASYTGNWKGWRNPGVSSESLSELKSIPSDPEPLLELCYCLGELSTCSEVLSTGGWCHSEFSVFLAKWQHKMRALHTLLLLLAAEHWKLLNLLDSLPATRPIP